MENLCKIQIDPYLCESGLLIIAFYPEMKVFSIQGKKETKQTPSWR